MQLFGKHLSSLPKMKQFKENMLKMREMAGTCFKKQLELGNKRQVNMHNAKRKTP